MREETSCRVHYALSLSSSMTCHFSRDPTKVERTSDTGLARSASKFSVLSQNFEDSDQVSEEQAMDMLQVCGFSKEACVEILRLSHEMTGADKTDPARATESGAGLPPPSCQTAAVPAAIPARAHCGTQHVNHVDPLEDEGWKGRWDAWMSKIRSSNSPLPTAVPLPEAPCEAPSLRRPCVQAAEAPFKRRQLEDSFEKPGAPQAAEAPFKRRQLEDSFEKPPLSVGAKLCRIFIVFDADGAAASESEGVSATSFARTNRCRQPLFVDADDNFCTSRRVPNCSSAPRRSSKLLSNQAIAREQLKNWSPLITSVSCREGSDEFSWEDDEVLCSAIHFSPCSPMAARTVAGSRQNAGSLTASSDAEEDELSCASTSDLHQLGSSASRRLDGFLVQRAQERVFATACDTAARIEKADVASDDCFDSPSHWGCCELEKECTEFARSSPACSLLMMHSPPRGRKLMLGLDEDECNESSNTGTVPSTCTWQPFSPIMPYDTNGHARRTACSRAHHSERVIDAVGMDACNRRLGTDQPSPPVRPRTGCSSGGKKSLHKCLTDEQDSFQRQPAAASSPPMMLPCTDVLLVRLSHYGCRTTFLNRGYKARVPIISSTLHRRRAHTQKRQQHTLSLCSH